MLFNFEGDFNRNTGNNFYKSNSYYSCMTSDRSIFQALITFISMITHLLTLILLYVMINE